MICCLFASIMCFTSCEKEEDFSTPSEKDRSKGNVDYNGGKVNDDEANINRDADMDFSDWENEK